MKVIRLILLIFCLKTFGVQQKIETDSITYYLELANYNLEDKYNTTEAIKNINIAIELAKTKKNENKLFDAYYMLANVQLENGNYNESIVNFIRVANYYQFSKNINSKLANCYFSLAKCYLETKNKKNAKIYFQKSYEIYSKLDLSDSNLLVNLEKGLVLKSEKKLDEALIVFNQITAETTDNDPSITEAFYQISDIYIIKKEYQKALNSALNALKLCQNETDFYSKIKIIKKIIFCYERLGDYKNANLYLHNYLLKSNNLKTKNTEDNYLYSKKKYDERLDIIEQLEKEKLDQQKTIKFSKLIYVLSIALISILSILCFSLYKNNRIRKHTFNVLQEKNIELTLQKEKAEQASNARADFLSTVSHELRTPLNGINGLTYLLLNEKPKPTQLHYLKSLEFSGKYLLDYINDILEINRLESDKVEIEKIIFNLPELITNISTSFEGFIKDNNVSFHLAFKLEEKSFFIGDPTKISQILINLISNAIKFTKNGNVWVVINRIEKHLINFEIKDNGIGIPEDKIATIFESFTQGSVTINRKFGGTGLGLSIVKKIIEILGSNIQLKSEENKGTSFTFSLKLEEVENQNMVIEPEEKKRLKLKNKTVLLVEDNKINQMITQKMVENKGMLCTTIDNGEDAIEILKIQDFDIVLMDVHLPGINGTEATKIIRTFDNETPIIALTAISLNENRENLISFGMNDVITKPFNPDYFYKVIAELLK